MKTSSAFLNGIIEYMQARQYAKRTIETYLYWIRQYILFNHKQHPSQLAEPEVEAFLTYLVIQRKKSGVRCLVLDSNPYLMIFNQKNEW